MEFKYNEYKEVVDYLYMRDFTTLKFIGSTNANGSMYRAGLYRKGNFLLMVPYQATKKEASDGVAGRKVSDSNLFELRKAFREKTGLYIETYRRNPISSYHKKSDQHTKKFFWIHAVSGQLLRLTDMTGIGRNPVDDLTGCPVWVSIRLLKKHPELIHGQHREAFWQANSLSLLETEE